MTGPVADPAPQVRVGCDVQPVAEVERAVADFGDRYLERVYTADERRVLAERDVESIAGRFAAKEAVVKLIGLVGPLDHRDIEVLADESGRPWVRLGGAVRRHADDQGIGAIDLSISHGGGAAFAVAVALSGGALSGGALCDEARCGKVVDRAIITDTWGG